MLVFFSSCEVFLVHGSTRTNTKLYTHNCYVPQRRKKNIDAGAWRKKKLYKGQRHFHRFFVIFFFSLYMFLCTDVYNSITQCPHALVD